jgi:peptidoglycan hydrolase-like protein with peptidoglycan-binding domain
MPSHMSRRKPRVRNSSRRARAGITAAAAGVGVLAAAAPAAAEAPALTGLLNQGSKGASVARLQRALHVRDSGRFDRATHRAVLAFQHKDQLLVDGIVGPQTWDALFHITPPPAPTTTTATPTSTSSSTSGESASTSTGGYTIPSGIVQCESGGNYGAVNASSGAGGAYQIMPSTWAAYGGQGLPQDAPKSEQDAIAAKIYANQGPSAWTC